MLDSLGSTADVNVGNGAGVGVWCGSRGVGWYSPALGDSNGVLDEGLDLLQHAVVCVVDLQISQNTGVLHSLKKCPGSPQRKHDLGPVF